MEEIKEILGPEHVIFKITEELVDSDEDGDILEKIGSLIDLKGNSSNFIANSTSSTANLADESWKTQINTDVDTEAYIDILLNNPSIINDRVAIKVTDKETGKETETEKESNPFIPKNNDQKEIETIGWTDWIRSFVIYTDKKTSIRNKRKKDAEIKPSDYELSYDELKATTRNRSGLPRIFPNLSDDSGLYHVNIKEPKQIVFGGCAGMYHYFLGIASVLQEKFDMSDVVFGCVSGGSFPALALILDLPVKELHETWNKEILRELNKSSLKAFSRLNGIVFEKSKKYIPVDAHIVAKNRLFISLTEFPSLKNHIVHYWQTIDSLLDCIQASCFIPIFDKRFWTIFDSTKYVDGGLSNNKPIPYPESPYIYITTDKWREIPLHWYWCYTSETWSDQLFEWGVSDTLAHLDEFSFLTPISKK